MINDNYIKSIINDELSSRNLFLIDIKINSANKINVFIDSMKGVTIDECAKLSYIIKEKLNNRLDDYALEVSSPGLDKSLVLPVQYEKNLGRDLDIITKDGNRITGKLTSVTGNGIEIITEVTKKKKSNKRREHVTKKQLFDFADIRSAKVIVLFN
ncbi:MAG: ribosome assembly cofactor RimP [Bacteroidales bacterium]|nr:MAG: ribosome assembly cofactor RimP [Bacteroidales bacterium]